MACDSSWIQLSITYCVLQRKSILYCRNFEHIIPDFKIPLQGDCILLLCSVKESHALKRHTQCAPFFASGFSTKLTVKKFCRTLFLRSIFYGFEHSITWVYWEKNCSSQNFYGFFYTNIYKIWRQTKREWNMSFLSQGVKNVAIRLWEFETKRLITWMKFILGVICLRISTSKSFQWD